MPAPATRVGRAAPTADPTNSEWTATQRTTRMGSGRRIRTQRREEHMAAPKPTDRRSGLSRCSRFVCCHAARFSLRHSSSLSFVSLLPPLSLLSLLVSFVSSRVTPHRGFSHPPSLFPPTAGRLLSRVACCCRRPPRIRIRHTPRPQQQQPQPQRQPLEQAQESDHPPHQPLNPASAGASIGEETTRHRSRLLTPSTRLHTHKEEGENARIKHHPHERRQTTKPKQPLAAPTRTLKATLLSEIATERGSEKNPIHAKQPPHRRPPPLPQPLRRRSPRLASTSPRRASDTTRRTAPRKQVSR